jgi:hypothetical protein
MSGEIERWVFRSADEGFRKDAVKRDSVHLAAERQDFIAREAQADVVREAQFELEHIAKSAPESLERIVAEARAATQQVWLTHSHAATAQEIQAAVNAAVTAVELVREAAAVSPRGRASLVPSGN